MAGGCFGGCVNSCEPSCPAQCCPSYIDAGQICNAQCPSSCAPSCSPECCGAILPALAAPEIKIVPKKRPPPIIPVVGPSPFDTCPGACPMSCAPGCDFDCCRPFLDPSIVQEMRSEIQPNSPQQEAAPQAASAVQGDQSSPMTRVIHVSHVLRPDEASAPAARSSTNATPANCPSECKQHCSPSCAKDGCCTDKKKRRRKRKRSHIPHSPRISRVYEDIYDREFNEQPAEPFYYEFNPDF